jgi:amidase
MPVHSSLTLMAQMVRSREISPVELAEEHLAQIAAHNPKLNAFVTVLEEETRTAARKAETAVMRGETLGMLHGVPVTVKDSLDMAGLPTYCGTRFRVQHRATEDSTAALRFRDNGAVILGKTNCPEFLANYETDNLITGRTNNPWDLGRTAGGSSGGESAAIASYCSAGGIGSDGGGSIRIPAAFCGIAGLKPTPGRVPAAGHFPEISHPGGLLGVIGPMARTAQDVRLLFAALAGHDDQDPFSAPVPLRPALLHNVKVGVWPQYYDVPVDSEIESAVQKAASLLAELKIPAEPFTPQGLESATELWWFFFTRIWAPFTRQRIQDAAIESHWTGLELYNMVKEDPGPSANDILINLGRRDAMRSVLFRQMNEYPVLLMPACGTVAWPHQTRAWATGGRDIGLLDAMSVVTPWNLLGMPGMVIPFGMHSSGVPIGIQLIGKPYSEELLLEIAVQLEAARGLFAGPPEY